MTQPPWVSTLSLRTRLRHAVLAHRWEDLAAKYGMSLDWDAIGRGITLPAESAEESKAVNGDSSASPATFEAVEQKMKDSKVHRKYGQLRPFNSDPWQAQKLV